MKPTIGRIVHYCLNEADAEAINRRRADFRTYEGGNTGHVGHTGNSSAAGQYYAAIVVATFNGADVANLQVFLDGNDAYWATSRGEGSGEGQWTWPPRVGA